MLALCSFKDVGCRFKVKYYRFQQHLQNIINFIFAFIIQGLRGKQMDAHMEESSQQHLTLMCSVVTKQQQQIVSMKKVINNLAVNQSGKLKHFKLY